MTEKLPGVLAEIAEVAGTAAAIAIASHKGGTRVYIPAKIQPDQLHWLVVVVGFDKAVKLCQHFAVDRRRGQYMEIPLCVGGTYRQMIRAIAERVHRLDQDPDASERAIAQGVGVTTRTVRRHRARHGGRTNKRQGRLL